METSSSTPASRGRVLRSSKKKTMVKVAVETDEIVENDQGKTLWLHLGVEYLLG
jgi:hypothetical protein